jgi:phage tail-like protein
MAQQALNPLTKFNYTIEIDGLLQGVCQDFKVPDMELSVATYGAGANPDIKEGTKRKIGDAEMKNLKLKDRLFYDWLKSGEKKLVIVKLLDKEGKVAIKYELKNCFVSKKTLDNLVSNDEGTEFLMETITLSVEDYEEILG